MKLHVDLKERGYDIVMERGVLHRLAQEVDLNRNVLLVSDSKVPVQWIDAVKEQCPHCVVKIVPVRNPRALRCGKNFFPACWNITFCAAIW